MGGVENSRGELERLLARVALGEREAFLAVYERTSAKLYGVCLRILKDRTMADDALQDVYVKIWRNADSYRAGRNSPMSWLIAIARNHAIDMMRAAAPATDALDEAAELAVDAPDPEASAIIGSEAQRMQKCLDELDRDKAASVKAAYVEGYSYRELADRYAVPINTMRTWLRRSLIRLRECLERPADD